jgi:energy-coupling factor transporter ATP-binding protein EcfA2
MPNEPTVAKLFQMSGIKKSMIENTEYSDNVASVKDASKILAKSFINGKCDHFESSSLFLVTGNEGSGKTLFTKKLKTLFENQSDPKLCTIFEQFNVKKSLTEIKSWFSKNGSKISEKKEVGIIELSNIENIDDFLLNLSKQESDIKISIINLMPVGNSYEYLMKNMPQKRFENEYLALTKLDLCDLSIVEIAAFVELNHKCMFFSGVRSSEEGLYFAKVGETADHIVQTMESRMG